MCVLASLNTFVEVLRMYTNVTYLKQPRQAEVLKQDIRTTFEHVNTRRSGIQITTVTEMIKTR